MSRTQEEAAALDSVRLQFAKRIEKNRPYSIVEKEARWQTWKAYHKRNEGRLFDPGPHLGAERRQRDWMDEEWFGKAIGCVAILDPEAEYYPYTFEECVATGVFLGHSNGFFGSIDFVIGSWQGPGSSLHRSPLNIGFVHVLGGAFQELAEINYREDEDDYEW
jgi:hypothetical protein